MRWRVTVVGTCVLLAGTVFSPSTAIADPTVPVKTEISNQGGNLSGLAAWGTLPESGNNPSGNSDSTRPTRETGPVSALRDELVIPAGSSGDCTNNSVWARYAECAQLPLPPDAPIPVATAGPTPVGPSVAEVARMVVVRLKLPDPTPQVGPDPSANEWQMLPVGYPVWLWTVGPDDLSATTKAYGYTFTLQAVRTSTVFTLGDGHSVTCTAVTPYSASVAPGSASPTCGYTYAEPSRPGPDYPVSATTRWRVTWTAAGETGVITATHTGNSTLAVGELFALVTK